MAAAGCRPAARAAVQAQPAGRWTHCTFTSSAPCLCLLPLPNPGSFTCATCHSTLALRRCTRSLAATAPSARSACEREPNGVACRPCVRACALVLRGVASADTSLAQPCPTRALPPAVAPTRSHAAPHTSCLRTSTTPSRPATTSAASTFRTGAAAGCQPKGVAAGGMARQGGRPCSLSVETVAMVHSLRSLCPCPPLTAVQVPDCAVLQPDTPQQEGVPQGGGGGRQKDAGGGWCHNEEGRACWVCGWWRAGA